jgi:hypothetical protein
MNFCHKLFKAKVKCRFFNNCSFYLKKLSVCGTGAGLMNYEANNRLFRLRVVVSWTAMAAV